MTGDYNDPVKIYKNARMWQKTDNWIYQIKGYLPSKGDPWASYATESGTAWVCPSDTKTAILNGKYQCPSYGINRLLTGFYTASPGWLQYEPYKLSQIEEPTKTPLMSDADNNWGCYPNHIAEDPGFHPFPHYHRNGDTFLYVDCHVSIVPNLDVSYNGNATMWIYIKAGKYFVQDFRFWD
jgi:hypothetical protein